MNSSGNWLLRRLRHRHDPKDVVAQRKSGLAIPVSYWLGGALRNKASVLLDEKRMAEEGFVKVPLIAQARRRHRELSGEIWAALTFQMWPKDLG